MNHARTLKHSSELAVAEGEAISCPPPVPGGAGRAELSTAQPSFILCPYDFIKLMSGNNHSFAHIAAFVFCSFLFDTLVIFRM